MHSVAAPAGIHPAALKDMSRRPANISINHLTHRFLVGTPTEVVALQDVSLEIPDGEFHCLLGPSGCGKSTLLYLMGGFLPIQEGQIATGGRQVVKPGPDRGIVFQSFALFPWKTVLQNVLYGLEKLAIPRKERLERAHHFIDLVHLSGFEDSFPAQLSGGMQQRAAIARTLATDPDVLLMDEPFGALDAQTRRIMQEEVLSIWRKSNKLVVFVTHDVQEAVFLGSRISVMSARPGRISQLIDLDFNRSGDPDVMRRADFAEQVEHVWNLVRHEAMAATRGH
jgi:NitT/TauT family transport system ATP-binding protein